MVNVVYACNDAYVRQTIVSMASVLEHNPDAKLYLISDRIGEANRKLIGETLGRLGAQAHLLELDEVLPQIAFDEADRHPRTVYAKLFLGEAISENRILYLDSDVIVADTLEPLFSGNMEGKLAGGVLMPYSSRVKVRNHCRPGVPYICDGVVLFNLELWRREGMSEACADYIRQQKGKPPMLSEGTLNHVCGERIEVLEPRYNVMPSMLMYSLDQIRTLFKADHYYQRQVELDEAREKPAVIHFMNELYNRPWLEPCDHPMREKYRSISRALFADMTWKKKEISIKTKVTKRLFGVLPFEVFSMLYKIKNRI